MGVGAAATQYLLGGFFLSIALGVSPFDPAPDAGGRVFAAVFAVALFLFGRWGRHRLRDAVERDTMLVVQGADLVVRHDTLLVNPAVIARSAVRVVAVDDAARPRAEHSLPVLTEDGSRWLTWFWERHSGAAVPLLGPAQRAPNLVVLFDRPVDFMTRAGGDARPAQGEVGLLVRVKDTAAAQEAFAGWQVVRPLTGEDLTRARAGPPRPAVPYGV